MFLDVKTVFLCNILIAVSFGCSYLIYAKFRKTYEGFMVWTAATFCNAFAFIVFLFRGPIPPAISIVVTNFLLALVVLLRLDATMRYLRGTKLAKLYYIIPILISCACGYFYIVEDRGEIRNLIISSTLLLFLLPIVWLFVKYPIYKLRYLYYAVVSLIAVRIVLAWVGAILGYRHTIIDQFDGGFYSAFFFTVLLLGEMGIGIIFLLINNHRAEIDLFVMKSLFASSSMNEKGDESSSSANILSICSYCKGIRGEENVWQSLEMYLSEHINTNLSHGICPECVKKYFPAVDLEKLQKEKFKVA